MDVIPHAPIRPAEATPNQNHLSTFPNRIRTLIGMRLPVVVRISDARPRAVRVARHPFRAAAQ